MTLARRPSPRGAEEGGGGVVVPVLLLVEMERRLTRSVMMLKNGRGWSSEHASSS
jgi:hypothetical protein